VTGADRRLARAATVAIVVAAVAGVTLTADSPGDPIGPARPRPPGALVEPLGYSPGWVPSGVREWRRQSYELGPGRVERYWARSAPNNRFVARPYLRMTVRPIPSAPADLPCGSGWNTRIDRRPAYLLGDGDDPLRLCWHVDAGTAVILENQDLLDRRSLLRMAGSMRRDPAWAVFPIQPPADLQHWASAVTTHPTATVGGTSPTDWQALITTDEDDEGEVNSLRIRLARTTSAPEGGESLTVGGRPARYVEKTWREAARFYQFVVVEVGPRWLLTVESWTITASRRGRQPPAPSRQDLVEAATRTRVDLSTTGWIGRRS
jgi:hypothetical protein